MFKNAANRDRTLCGLGFSASKMSGYSLSESAELTQVAGRIDKVRSPLRILHVIHSLSLKHGGPPEGLRQLAEGYCQEGIHLEVASLDDPREAFLGELPFVTHALGPAKSGYGYSSRLFPWLQEHLKDYDALVINGIWQYHCFAAWRAARNKLPFAVFVHGALDPWFKKKYPLKHVKKLLYWRPFQYPVLRDALAVLFTTETEKEQALLSFQLNRWNGVVVPYGTSQPTGNPDAQKEEFFAACPAVRNHSFLLFMARIHEKKGCDLLIDAFSRVRSRACGLHLVMAGPDQVGWTAALQKQARRLGVDDRVHWPGLLQKGAKWGAIYASEAFILPSHQENFGIGVAEALACGRPVLISDKVNIWEDVIADGAGIVDEDTAEGTHRLLTKWLEMPENERSEMSQKASKCFVRRYSMRGTAKAIRVMFEHEIDLVRNGRVYNRTAE
ncbi:glycosyltransferase [Alloacidobacterium sp.]|uniref:glycosyltransferase n=1 Tax=Alloacidobacterium sp. TaxID=2951999 RepID=UPI002D2DA6D0|nr:glycosyltransferase [Alloacidobacterium sp.]HYK34993.1 glycosyltransferase [Alloacidobacterium sp.]